LLRSELWQKKPFSIGQAWIDLLLKAAWTGHEVFKNSSSLHIDRGQLVTTLRALSRDWGISRDKVKSTLNLYHTSAMISTENRPHFLIITITNYDTYQGQDEKTDQKSANNRPKTGHQSATPPPKTRHGSATLLQDKKDKEVKEGKEVREPSAPTPPPLTAATAPPNGQQTDNVPQTEPDPPIPPAATELVSAGRHLEAIPILLEAGCLAAARRAAMKSKSLAEITRVAKLIQEAGR
jgi:hypothetical protein